MPLDATGVTRVIALPVIGYSQRRIARILGVTRTVLPFDVFGGLAHTHGDQVKADIGAHYPRRHFIL